MYSEVIPVRNDYQILSTSSRFDDRTRVLKHGDTFAVFDRFGDIGPAGRHEFGLYYRDTRFLSRLTLLLADRRPFLLSSTIKEDNALLNVDLTNPDLEGDGAIAIPRGTVHLFRSKVLWQGRCYERLRACNYGGTRIELPISVAVAADFVDIFEVRGMTRARRGRLSPVQVLGDTVLLEYEGLDRRIRRTRIVFRQRPAWTESGSACFDLVLRPGEEAVYDWTICCELDAPRAGMRVSRIESAESGRLDSYERAAEESAAALRAVKEGIPSLFTSNEQFNDWVNRSSADLAMLMTDTPYGVYPYAGVPWYSTVFGRDGIVTALACLWADPAPARGVLSYLAAVQAESDSPEQDAQPGKILHETRGGEMAALGEHPFGRYYGSVDATPLFVMLAGAYYDRTGDRDFAEKIWPAVERALEWIDRYGDLDGDGLVEYAGRTPQGLVHQGWKDSADAVFHEDGAPAGLPVALCEVQGLVFAAKTAAAGLAAVLGLPAAARDLAAGAERLRIRFEEAFWCDELSTYALALDGDKQPCRVRTSNAGQCLFTGIASRDRARRVAATLLDRASYSGWGIRTVAAGEARYNPISYHNGSVWPHDNALIAAGFGRYGLRECAVEVMTGLFDASLFFDLHRLPELFCGFHRRPGEGPTLYPVACAPQAWASASAFLLLQASLGLEVRGPERQVVFEKPVLPGFLDMVRIAGLRVGSARIDLLLTRHEHDVEVTVLRREGDIGVVVAK